MSVVKQSAIWTCDSCGNQEKTVVDGYPGNFTQLQLDAKYIDPAPVHYKIAFDICVECYSNVGGSISNAKIRSKVAKFFLNVLKGAKP